MSPDPSSGEIGAEASPREAIERRIFVVRGLRVMLDHDLADLYGIETKALVRAMTRNRERFPEDFSFRLAPEEWETLRCQSGTSNEGRGGRQYAPCVFEELSALPVSAPRRTARNCVETHVVSKG
jgi:hypothetical protein